MYRVVQYYLVGDKINSHICSIEETLQGAYHELIEADALFPDTFMIYPSIPIKVREHFLMFVLSKNKDKDILTILAD